MPPQITIPSQVPGIGGMTIGGDAPQTPPDTSARDAIIADLAAKHQGQSGAATRVYTGTGNNRKDSGFDKYSFGDGSSIEISQDGQIQNQTIKQPSATATRNGGWGTPTPIKTTDANGVETTTYYGTDPTTQQVGPIPGLPQSTTQPSQSTDAFLAGQGLLNLGANGLYVKDANGQWAPSNATAVTQKLANDKSMADSNYQNALANKTNVDAALAADPTNVALKQQADQADIALKGAQQASYNATAAKTMIDAQVAQGQLGVNQGQLAVNQQQANTTAAKTASDISTAAGTLGVAQAKLPYEQQQLAGQANASNAQATAALAKAAEPTVWQTGTTQPFTSYYDPKTGTIQQAANPSYLPTDPGRMLAQLNQQANTQQQQLQQQVARGTLSPDQANSQFDQWWNQNVEPMKPEVATLQASQQAALMSAQAAAQQALIKPSYDIATLANTASNDAQSRVISMMPYVTGKNFDQAFGKALSGGWQNLSPSDVVGASTYSLPNLQQVGQQGAAAALAHLSPTAQAILNQPAPAALGQSMQLPSMPDINQMLNRGAYNFGGGAPGGAQPVPQQMGAPPAPMMPMGQPTPQQLINQGAAGAQVTSLGPFSGNLSQYFPQYTPGP